MRMYEIQPMIVKEMLKDMKEDRPVTSLEKLNNIPKEKIGRF